MIKNYVIDIQKYIMNRYFRLLKLCSKIIYEENQRHFLQTA